MAELLDTELLLLQQSSLNRDDEAQAALYDIIFSFGHEAAFRSSAAFLFEYKLMLLLEHSSTAAVRSKYPVVSACPLADRQASSAPLLMAVSSTRTSIAVTPAWAVHWNRLADRKEPSHSMPSATL